MASSVTYLPKGVLLQIEAKDLLASGNTIVWNKVSDHNRQPLSVSVERIEQATRMANGTLRKFYVDDKKSFSVSWTMLPGKRAHTADGYWGAEDLITFYQSDEGKATFRIKLNYSKDGTNQESNYNDEVYTVNCSSFNATLNKRGIYPFWDISMSMDQV